MQTRNCKPLSKFIRRDNSHSLAMKIIHNKTIPFGKRYLAINICGYIFTKDDLSVKQINHELIHTRQQRELLYVFFYLLYIAEWFVRLLQYRNLYKAYYNISFEREAYSLQSHLTYLNTRRPMSWLKYLTKKKIKRRK